MFTTADGTPQIQALSPWAWLPFPEVGPTRPVEHAPSSARASEGVATVVWIGTDGRVELELHDPVEGWQVARRTIGVDDDRYEALVTDQISGRTARLLAAAVRDPDGRLTGGRFVHEQPADG